MDGLDLRGRVRQVPQPGVPGVKTVSQTPREPQPGGRSSTRDPPSLLIGSRMWCDKIPIIIEELLGVHRPRLCAGTVVKVVESRVEGWGRVSV